MPRKLDPFTAQMTDGARLLQDVMGKRTRMTRHDRVMLTVRIDGLISCATSQERHRCFDIITKAQFDILETKRP